MAKLVSRRIRHYFKNDRKPWGVGYNEYKEQLIRTIINDDNMLEIFRLGKELPESFGYRIDERVIEYPWVLSRIRKSEHTLLDAGSTLNFQYIIDLPIFSDKNIYILTLSPEGVIKNYKISYIYGDLRKTLFKDEAFDEIVCISTLEHIGMDNSMLYSKNMNLKESKLNDYLYVIKEFNRLLKKDGILFLTVPYGKYENHGWLQQFDESMLFNIEDYFNGKVIDKAYFKYENDGWQYSNRIDCIDCSYFDIHNTTEYEHDYVAAARSVACIQLKKDQ